MGKPVKQVVKTTKYVLVKGNHFSRHPETGETVEHEIGTIHALNADQAKAWKDKFKSYPEYVAEQNRTRRVAAALKAAEAQAASEDADTQAQLEEDADLENAPAIEAAEDEEQLSEDPELAKGEEGAEEVDS